MLLIYDIIVSFILGGVSICISSHFLPKIWALLDTNRKLSHDLMVTRCCWVVCVWQPNVLAMVCVTA